MAVAKLYSYIYIGYIRIYQFSRTRNTPTVQMLGLGIVAKLLELEVLRG